MFHVEPLALCGSSRRRRVRSWRPLAPAGTHQRPRSRACGRPGALWRARPPQVGTLATHRGVSRGTVEHRTRGLGSAPAVHGGRPQVWTSSPIGTARGCTSTARSAVGVGEPAAASRCWPASCRRIRRRPRRAVAQRDRTTAAGFGARPAGVPVARVARSGHLLHRIGWRGHDRMLHVGLPAMRDGWRPEVRHLESPRMFHVKPWQCSTVEQFDPPEVVAAVADPACGRPTATSSRGPASAELYLLSRVLHDWGDWPQVRTPGPAGCAGCFTWNPQAMLGGPPPRVETPGLTRMGRPRPCSAADARRVGHANRPGRPWGCGGVPLQRPQTRMPGCSTWNRRQRPGGRRRRIRTPGCLV